MARSWKSEARRCSCGNFIEGDDGACTDCVEESVRACKVIEAPPRLCRVCQKPMVGLPDKARVCSAECRYESHKIWEARKKK